MPVTRDMLLAELKELQRLTAFEQAVATVRRAQAASEVIAQELATNAASSGERLGLLAQAVRGAGGTPDLVGPVLGKLGALVQTQVNQVKTLQGALLGDLALEHQLRDRARYARTLAVTLGELSVVPVLDRLDSAHGETIAWLERRLTEVGRTGSTAITATPVQAALGSVRRVAGAPLAVAALGINRTGALLVRLTGRVPAVLASVPPGVGAVADLVGHAADVVEHAADAVAEGGARAAQPSG